MGRKKIEIREIKDSRVRYTTFMKRKTGLIKKAAELSRLCQIKMLLMFEDLSGDLIQYSTDGIFEPSKYFEGANPAYVFTMDHYPRFFAKEPKTAANSDKVSLTSAGMKYEKRYLADEELSIEEAEDEEEDDEDIDELEPVQEKIHEEERKYSQPFGSKLHKNKRVASLKIQIPRDHNNSIHKDDMNHHQFPQKDSSFAKNLQELLLIESQNTRIRKRARVLEDPRGSENKISDANHQKMEIDQNNQMLPFESTAQGTGNLQTTPTANNPPSKISNNLFMSTTPTQSKLPMNLVINYAQGFQISSEPRRLSFSQEEDILYSQINSRPPSPLNCSFQSAVDHQVQSRRSSITSLLDLFRIEEEMVDEDQIGELPRPRSYNHSRVSSNISSFLNRLESKKFEDGFISRRHSNQSSIHQLYPNFNQRALHDSLNFDELPELDSSRKMSAELNNISRLLSRSHLTSNSGHKSRSLDRFALKKVSNNMINEAHSRSNSKDSDDKMNFQLRLTRQKSGIGSNLRLYSPLTSIAYPGREERSPLQNPKY